MGYADPEEEVKYLQIAPLHRMWLDTESRFEEPKKIQSFLGWIKWKADEVDDEEDAGGVTWLELHMLYIRHGGNKDEDEKNEKDPLRRPDQMKKQLAEFKHLMRKIARHAVSEEDDWHFQTCMKRATRLRAVAVEGRIPAIRGMPVVEEEDAEMIVKAILAMRRHVEVAAEEVADVRSGAGMEESMWQRASMELLPY